MPKLLTIVGSVLLAIAASVAACTDGAQETQRDDDASAFAREVVGVLEQVQLAHDALSDLGLEDLSASQQEARYSDLEAEMRLARGRIDDADAGWKGRGLWFTNGLDPIIHSEIPKSYVGKVQLRPHPLAH